MSQDWQPSEEATIARKLLRSMDCGVLSTMSVAMPGFPFGSVTPYVTTHDGHVVVLVSDIAQHTKNMQADDKVCMTVMDNADGNKQEQGRATIIGRARPVPGDKEEEVSSRYFAFFPEARHYSQAHDFTYFWVEPKKIRYIGGFGKIFWIEKEDWVVPKPAWSADEAGIMEHMNSDHQDALNAMAKFYGGVESEDTSLVAVDPEGCHIKAAGRICYIPFAKCAMTKDAVREAMVTLSKMSRA